LSKGPGLLSGQTMLQKYGLQGGQHFYCGRNEALWYRYNGGSSMDGNSGIPSPADTGNTEPEESSCTSHDNQQGKSGSESSPEVCTGMTLEQIIDITGEFGHLNELVMRYIEKSGGFAGPDAYFKTVQPLLDLLEVEIRVRCRAEMTHQQMKLIVQDWIDQEIRGCGDATKQIV